MLGSSHAASGMIVGLVSLPWATPGAPWWVQAGWVTVCGGAAVLVSRVARGHRAGTHDAILAPVVVAAGAWLASWWLPAFVVAVALTVGLVLRVTVLRHSGMATWMANLASSTVLGWGLAQHPQLVEAGHTMLPVALAVGVWTHQAGDLLTPEGLPVPVMWMFDPRRRIAFGLFATGQTVERWVIGPVLVVSVLVMGCWRAGIYSPGHLIELVHTWMASRPG